MSSMHIPPWAVLAAALLAPAALQAQAGTVVCKDGSNASTASACAQHGGIDSISTRAAERARPAPSVETGQADTAAKDTGMAGMKADTTLKAKPGLQTGKAKRRHKGAAADTMHQMHADSAKSPY
jgi:hypothetical protein